MHPPKVLNLSCYKMADLLHIPVEHSQQLKKITVKLRKSFCHKFLKMEQNHQYVYGREITLWTDQQPLVSIATKPLASTPKRLQRLLLRLRNYDVKVLYKPGKEMVLADTLSRAYIPSHNDNRSETEKDTEVVHKANHLAISEPQL